MMNSSENVRNHTGFERGTVPSGDGVVRTPQLSPDHLEERLSDLLTDPDRLEAVRQTALMDTPAEETFDRLTRMASQILNVPVVLVSLIDDERHYFKSDVGLPEPYASTRERAMAKSFCHYAIALGHPLVIEDAGQHSLVRDNPATEELGIGGYMGVPLVTGEGHGIGNFCAIDTEPRQWHNEQLQALEDLAASVMREIELRALERKLESAREPERTSQIRSSLPDFTGGRHWPWENDTAGEVGGQDLSRNGGKVTDRTELQFQRLLDTLPAGAYMCNREGLITYFNERAAEVWGREPELYDPVDRFCGSVQLYRPDGTPIDHSACWMALALKNDREYQEEIIIERPDGSRINAIAHAMPHHDASGKLVGAINVVTDITERKKAEEQLRKAKESAEEMSRLKSNLLANMSHEIRTPITAILGLTESLEEKVSEEKREEVRLIEKSSRQLMDTLDAVLALAQLEGGEVDIDTERITVSEEVRKIVGSFGHRTDEKNLSLEVTSSAPAAQARLDPRLLERILNKLVSNAIKFTDEGEITVEISASGEDVSIAVSDTGVGISEEFQEDLFEEFTQESTGFSRTHEGIGLGLPLTKRMTEQLGGEISVESEKGAGSTFTVSFPRAGTKSETDKKHSEPDKVDLAAEEIDMQATAVLLIEDNEIIRRVIVERLGERHGYEVEAFAEAEPALARANERAFDVVLIDISLPGIDGVEALQELRSTERYKDRPIIAVTGHALPGDRERFLEEGFSEHMGKPFSADDLAETIRSLDT